MKNNQSGFTLIEILIAVTLLSFVMLGIVTISENSIQTKDRVTSEDSKFLQVETALDRIEWDISHIYSPLYFSIEMQSNTEDEESLETYNGFIQKYSNNKNFNKVSYEALPIPRNHYEDSELTFFTLANRRKFENQKQSNFAWIQYSLAKTDSEDETSFQGTSYLVRKFLADDVFSFEAIAWDKIKSQILLKNVQSLKFQFWDYGSKKWKERLTATASGENIIRGVKMILKVQETEEEVKVFERVYRPLFPVFEPEDYYKLMRVEEDKFIADPRGEHVDDLE